MADRTIATDLADAAEMFVNDLYSVRAHVKEAFDMLVADLKASPVGPALEKLGEDFRAAGLFVKDAFEKTVVDVRALGGLFGVAFEKTAIDVQAFAAYIRPLTDALPAVGAGLATLGKGALDVASTIGTTVLGGLKLFGEGLLAGAASFGAVTGAAALFVQASNPAEMQRFTMALQDFMASIGVALEPVIVAGQQILDQFNRVFTDLRPVLMPVVDAFVTVFHGVADIAQAVLVPILEALAPAFQMVMTAVQPLIEPLVALGGAVGELVGKLVMVTADVLGVVLPPLVSGLTWLTDSLTLATEVIGIVIERLRNFSVWDPGRAFDIAGAVEEARANIQARALARELDRQRTGPGTVAARPASQIGIEQLGEQARAAAFGARSAADRDEERNLLLARIARGVEDIPDAFGEATGGGGDWSSAGTNALNGEVGLATGGGGPF